MPIMPMRPDAPPPRVASGTISSPAPKPYIPPKPKVGYVAPTPYRPPITPNSSGRYSAPAPPPVQGPGPVPSIDAFLGGDTGYQDQLRQLANALSMFSADVTRRKGSLESEYGLSQKAMQDQKLKDLDLLEEDYSSRGLLRSGLYGKAVGDYESEFGKRMADLARHQQEALSTLTQESGQFTSAQQLQKQAAMEAALRRRAERYGI